MERTLTNYIRALRAAGAAVSPAEAIDAARTLALMGYQDRAVLKQSLGVVLAKSVDEKELHDKLFDLYFSRQSAARPAEAQNSDQGQEAGETSADADSFMDLAQSTDADRMAIAMGRAARASGADEIRFASQASYFSRRMLETLGVEDLEARLAARLADRDADAQTDSRVMIDARTRLQRQARAVVNQRFEVFGRSATETFMNEVVINRPIDQLAGRDMERMEVLVAKMAKRLAVKHARRRKVRNRGQLDIRHTLRANAGHDGVLFDLVWRRKKKDRPKIVAICDVSGSVAQYVRFLLLFLSALNDKVTDLGAFAFSFRLRDVSSDLKDANFETAVNRIIREVGGGSTDYGQALLDLKDNHWETIDRRTTVLILGDGRSNYGDPGLEIIQEMADRAKRVIWLCPEPPNRWGVGDSCIPQYRPFCDHLSYCSTAVDIEQALDDVLMAYD